MDARYLYFAYLKNRIKGEYYDNLLEFLHNLTFDPLEMGKNRSLGERSTLLREDFSYEFRNYGDEKGYYIKGTRPTALEILITLAYIVENRVMRDPKIGDRTLDWFWKLIEDLEMDKATDEKWCMSWQKWVKKRFQELMKQETPLIEWAMEVVKYG